MPTAQEKVAQIEIALRQRFFPLVPKIEKPERANWTEEQHDVDRLSRALAAYTIVGLCDVHDITAAAAITDGSNDGGIDAFFVRGDNKLLLVQSKFKRGGACASQQENLKTINGVRALLARRFNEFNQAFQNRLDEIEAALDTPGVQLEIVLVFLGENVSPHVIQDLNGFKTEINNPGPLLDWHAHTLSNVYDWLVEEQTPSTVDTQITLENWVSILAPRRAIYGQISANELAQIASVHGKALFQRNIRYYLGSVRVNEAIENTVLNQPAELFYLNNGITAIAEVITPSAGNQNRCNFGLSKVSIVNGAQTVGTILNASLTQQIPANAKLLISIIETGPAGDDIGLRITRARNNQTAVKSVDFVALDTNQERLRQELAIAGIEYHYRPSAEASLWRENAFKVGEASLALSCLSFPVVRSTDIQQNPALNHSNAINYAVAAKKEVGRLWDQDGPYYPRIFTPTLSGIHLFRMVRIYRLIDITLNGTEWSETSYQRRMFFRHGRYFIMTFVAHLSLDIINRPSIDISQEDKNVLSRRINEISELIYNESVPMQIFKGYLSIFRNLGDSQPLADRVLNRLAQQDAAAVPIANPNITTQPTNEVQP